MSDIPTSVNCIITDAVWYTRSYCLQQPASCFPLF